MGRGVGVLLMVRWVRENKKYLYRKEGNALGLIVHIYGNPDKRSSAACRP